MRSEGYRQFHAIPLTEGFPPGWPQPALIDSYRALVAEGVFYPALHGFTHFNPELMMALAREDSARGARVRALHENGIPYLASLTPEFNFALLDRSGAEEKYISRDAQLRWMEQGVQIFREAFGHPPASTCAPGYRFDRQSTQLWRQLGVRVVHQAGGAMASESGLWFLPRTVHFEPVLAGDALATATVQAARAVQRGEPIVISTHSINYVGRHLGRAAEGREMLSQLLRTLLQTYPGLRFAGEAELHESWLRRDPSWWRPARVAEIARRMEGA
jgi:hypothetical protein